MSEPAAERKRKRGFANEASVPVSNEWYTPAHVFEALGLDFDLDVASPGLERTPWIPARRCFTLADDALSQRWTGRVWCNPPYGDQVARFIGRLADHGDGIALVFARTDTRWFARAAATCDVVCFTAGRIQFVYSEPTRPANPPAGSALFAYGDTCAEALVRSGLGVCMAPLGTLRAQL